MRPERAHLRSIQKEIQKYNLDTAHADAERRRYAIYWLKVLLRELQHFNEDLLVKEIEETRHSLVMVVTLVKPTHQKAFVGLPAPQITSSQTLMFLRDIEGKSHDLHKSSRFAEYRRMGEKTS